MEGSWLSNALPRYSPSPSSHENRRIAKPPRWRSPSPMSASIVPPPIVSSVYAPASPPSPDTASAPVDDDLLLFRRKQRQLEAQLQLLLDAQADGLLSGLDASTAPTNEEDSNSTGSSTPTAINLNARSKSINKSEKLGLHEARYTLYATIRRLAQLKAQESHYLTPNIDHFAAIVSQLETWQKKRHALHTKTSQIHSGSEQERAVHLHRQADAMQNDINELETKLAHMKTEQRQLRAEAQEIENTVDARLSSYTTSLALVDENVQAFLQDDSLNRWAAVINVADMNRFWKLPRHHRTLEAARDVFTRERDSLLEKRSVNDTEREALEEGAVVWKDTVKQVSAFERKLAKAMSRLCKQPTASEDGPPSDSPATTEELLALLDRTTTELETKHKLADTRNWKLLVCAIGAELEAFLKGKQILETALASTGGDAIHNEADGVASGSGHLEGVQTPRGGKDDDGEAIRDLDTAFATEHIPRSVSDTDTEDDGPDPELLISHQDTDTE